MPQWIFIIALWPIISAIISSTIAIKIIVGVFVGIPIMGYTLVFAVALVHDLYLIGVDLASKTIEDLMDMPNWGDRALLTKIANEPQKFSTEINNFLDSPECNKENIDEFIRGKELTKLFIATALTNYEYDSSALVKKLLDKGADPDHEIFFLSHKTTPFFASFELKKWNIAEIIIDYKAQSNSQLITGPDLQNNSNKKINIDQLLSNGKTALFEALFYMQENLVRKLINYGADPNLKIMHNGQKTSPFLFAVEHDKWQAISELVKSDKIDVNARLKSGETLLYKAVRSGLATEVKILIDQGADPDLEIIHLKQKTSPFLYLLEKKNWTLLEIFLESGAILVDRILPNGKTLLFEATYLEAADFVRKLIELGANPNIEIRHEGRKTSPFLFAVNYDKWRIISELIKSDKIDINARLQSGETLLYQAVSRGLATEVKRLIDQGADPDLEISGIPIFLYAIQTKNDIDRKLDILESMFSATKTNPDIILANGKTLLFEAIYYGKTDFVRKLLASRADPNIEIIHLEQKTSPLLYIIDQKKWELLKIFLESEAILVDKILPNGKTLLFEATYLDAADFVRKLIKLGADPNIEIIHEDRKTSPFLFAVEHDKWQAISELVKSDKIDINARLKSGETLLYKAVRSGLVEEVKMLIDHGADPDLEIAGIPIFLYAIQTENDIDRKLDILESMITATKTNPDITLANGKTLLFEAIQYEKTNLVKKLLASKANPDIEIIYPDGKTSPFIYAVNTNSACTIDLLGYTKADIDTILPDGKTILYKAITILNDLNITKKILDKSGDPLLLLNPINGEKNTSAFKQALLLRKWDEVNLLLKYIKISDQKTLTNCKNIIIENQPKLSSDRKNEAYFKIICNCYDLHPEYGLNRFSENSANQLLGAFNKMAKYSCSNFLDSYEEL